MSVSKIVVDSDVFLDHLTHAVKGKTRPSMLRRLMSGFFCYTTVFNAIELFSLCRTGREIEAVENSMHAVKVLGLNARGAKRIGPMLRLARRARNRDLDILIAGLCIESRLPLVTNFPHRYRGMKQLRVMPVRQLLRHARLPSGEI